MRKELEAATVPYLATAAVRDRIRRQLDAAERLQQESTTRTRTIQWLGSLIILFGVFIIVFAIGASTYNMVKIDVALFAGLGVFTNLVGVLLISFHKISSNLSLEYYDRRQKLFDQLTALELTTNDLLAEKRPDVLSNVIDSLTDRK